MGYNFTVVETEGLPVQFPEWPNDPSDSLAWAAWEAGRKRFNDAAPEDRGLYDCSSGLVELLTEALTATGTLIEMEHGPWPEVCWRETPEGRRELTEAGRAFLSQGAGQGAHVPAFKFNGAAHWIFTPQECQWMADALRTHPDSRVRGFGRFCEVAAQHGGFSAD